MTRIGKVLMIMRWLLLGLAGALLPPAAAHAQCTAWDVSQVPQWRLEQGNGFDLMVTFQQHGSQVGGTASLYTGGNNFQGTGQIIDGSIIGSSLSFKIQWSSGAVGAYSADVSDGHLVNGITIDQGGSRATWKSLGTAAATCIAEASPPAPPPAPPPPKAPPPPPANPLDKAGVFEKPGPGIGEILKETKPAGAEYATAITPATIYVEPGGAAFKDANGDDIGMNVGSKALVLEKRTNPVWYKLQTKPVGWVWGEDVTLGP